MTPPADRPSTCDASATTDPWTNDLGRKGPDDGQCGNRMASSFPKQPEHRFRGEPATHARCCVDEKGRRRGQGAAIGHCVRWYRLYVHVSPGLASGSDVSLVRADGPNGEQVDAAERR